MLKLTTWEQLILTHMDIDFISFIKIVSLKIKQIALCVRNEFLFVHFFIKNIKPMFLCV